MHDQRRDGFSRRSFLIGAGAATAAATMGLGGCSKGSGGGSDTLVVAGLPVTCNLTLPIAAAARENALKAGTAKGVAFEFSKYNGWPEIKESLMAGRIDAAYMLAPLIMDLASRNVPVKIVSLGHRSGAVIMVRTDSGYQKFKDLAGKRVAIPSRFAVDFLFLRKMLAQENMTPKDVELIELPPPDMPAALYAKAVDAYCTGEPFGAAAQKAGYAVPLKMTRDEWPKYMCCVLTVREELLQSKPDVVQELVNYVLGAGNWLDQSRENRTRAAEIAAEKRFFGQDKEVLQYVMDNPPDRVTYGDLKMIKSEFDEMMRLSIEAGTIKSEIPFETYVDEQFVKAAMPAEIKA